MEFFSENNNDINPNEINNSTQNNEPKPIPNVFALFAKSLG